MHIVFTGIQGCGKGTQARLLVEKYGFTLVEMGNEFRKVISSKSELGEKLKKILNSGEQVGNDIGKEIMQQAILSNNGEKIIFDGFIRNSWNKEIFDELLSDYKVIFFELSVEKAKKRLLGRMFDKETGETFLSDMEINPKTGGKLVKREDDKDEKAILKRISEYENKTLPIVEIQKKEGKILFVNADQSINNVFEELLNKLNLK